MLGVVILTSRSKTYPAVSIEVTGMLVDISLLYLSNRLVMNNEGKICNVHILEII